MSNATIINHSGSTSLLSKPVEEGGKNFPFLFQAVKPEDRRWAFRLLPFTPEHLTDQKLTQQLHDARPILRADWEEQTGHPVGLLTIYLPPKDGKSETREGRFDWGPELGPDMMPARPNVPQPMPPFGNGKARHKPKESSPDLGF